MDAPDRLRQAADELLRLPADARVRLVAVPTVDALAGAAVLGLSFRRMRRTLHMTVVNPEDRDDVERIARDPYDANVLLGLPLMPRVPGRLVAISPRPPHVSLSGEALELAVRMDAANEDLAPIALAGAWAAGPPPPASAEAQLGSRLIAIGKLGSRTRLDLVDAPLPTAVSRGAPWTTAFPTPDEAVPVLAENGLAVAATPYELDAQDSERLASLVVLRLLRSGFPAHRVKELMRAIPESPLHRDTPLPRVAHLAAVGLGRGDPGLVLAYLMGDVNAANELEALESQDVPPDAVEVAE